jgi:hypothetical protein
MVAADLAGRGLGHLAVDEAQAVELLLGDVRIEQGLVAALGRERAERLGVAAVVTPAAAEGGDRRERGCHQRRPSGER